MIDLFSCALVFEVHICLYEDVGSPGTGVTGSYELPCGCWDLNSSGPLEEKPVMLLVAEPSVQPPWHVILIHVEINIILIFVDALMCVDVTGSLMGVGFHCLGSGD